MRVWRIAAAAREYAAADLSGTGSARSPGRWNEMGVAMVYCAENRSLAMLETLAHVPGAGLPQNRYLVAVDIPDAIWTAREVLEQDRADDEVPTWDSLPAAGISSMFGAKWIREGRSAVLCVPSVIVPEEHCVLVNPVWVGAAGIEAHVVRRVAYEAVVRRPAA
ncbi:MAG: RES family NAD+ phosphorylase [Lautropia sp.]